MPIDGTRSIAYRAHPFILHQEITGENVDSGRLRGGSQFLQIGTAGDLLGIVHDVVWHGNKREYLHRFALIKSCRLHALSDAFYFERKGIEFCAGLARDSNTLIASFGVDDKEPWLAKFSLPDVLSRLKTDYVI
jgi:hypothetical protein